MDDLKEKAVAGCCPCYAITFLPPRIFTQVRNVALCVAGTATVAGATIGLSHVPVTWTAFFGPPPDVRSDHTHNEPGRNPIYFTRPVGAVSRGMSR
jgi:hypothetical protein